MQKLEEIRAKIFNRDDGNLTKLLEKWRAGNQKIVFTNGCFDILHLGHIDYLAKAASLGDVLIIGLNTDESVRKLKTAGRPIQNEISRAMILASLSFADSVVFFGEETPYELIKTVQPDILVKGADYRPEDIVGFDIVNAKGGKVVTMNYLEGYSTSNIIRRILGNP